MAIKQVCQAQAVVIKISELFTNCKYPVMRVALEVIISPTSDASARINLPKDGVLYLYNHRYVPSTRKNWNRSLNMREAEYKAYAYSPDTARPWMNFIALERNPNLTVTIRRITIPLTLLPGVSLRSLLHISPVECSALKTMLLFCLLPHMTYMSIPSECFGA
ncbi:hypothetical protein ACGC1H_006258 [Rhizoctonia solani]